VGDGPEKINIYKKVTYYKLKKNVSFYGFREREFLQSFLPMMDIVVNPSFQE
jgi:glycosyltransferase involved in cell wall biosynthesis